jgi:transposase
MGLQRNRIQRGALRFNVYGVRQRIAAAGSELLYAPPYSPDLNPIEKAWFKLKQLLHAAKARTKEALEEAITELLPQITRDNAKAWLRLRLGTPLPTTGPSG